MRIVVDTNVFVSAALKGRSFPALALHTVAMKAILLKSAATERQLFDVLARPRLAGLIDDRAVNWFKALMAGAELVDIRLSVAACRDPTDDRFLELAINGRADMIISGDADLLALNPFLGVAILAPASFVAAMK